MSTPEITLPELLAYSRNNHMSLDQAYDALLSEKARDLVVNVPPHLVALATGLSDKQIDVLKEEARLHNVLHNLVKSLPDTVIDEIRDKTGIYGVETFVHGVQKLYLDVICADKFDLRPSVDARKVTISVKEVAKKNSAPFNFFEGTESLDQIEAQNYGKLGPDEIPTPGIRD